MPPTEPSFWIEVALPIGCAVVFIFACLFILWIANRSFDKAHGKGQWEPMDPKMLSADEARELGVGVHKKTTKGTTELTRRLDDGYNARVGIAQAYIATCGGTPENREAIARLERMKEKNNAS